MPWREVLISFQGSVLLDGIELEDKPSDSHVASTDQDQYGKIFRRNVPYGTVTDHGTMFVGFSADQRRLSTMLESMAGLRTGVRDASAWTCKGREQRDIYRAECFQIFR
jgi:hypothetical protein